MDRLSAIFPPAQPALRSKGSVARTCSPGPRFSLSTAYYYQQGANPRNVPHPVSGRQPVEMFSALIPRVLP